MKKTTVRASSDVALVKYWGKKDEILRLPENGSISLILEGLDTVTSVEFQKDLPADVFEWNGQVVGKESVQYRRVSEQLDRVRKLAKLKTKAKVSSKNSFPADTGLSSSGSGMAALTIAAVNAANLNLSEKELSILARQASGTACRCVCGGFVEWHGGETSDTSFAETIFSASHWDLRDVVAIVSEEKKFVSSTTGHAAAQSSPFYAARQAGIAKKLDQARQAIVDRDFTALGELIEAEALEFHSILLTSQPAIIALHPGSLAVIQAVRALRNKGVEAYFTINTGFNVHVLTLPENQEQVQQEMSALPVVQKTLLARTGGGPQELVEHLF